MSYLTKAVIIDLDGSFADTLNMPESSYATTDWDLHNENNVHAESFEWCREIVKKFSTDYHVLFVTGRQDSRRTRLATEMWLQRHIPSYAQYSLLMRSSGDFRADYLVKGDIYYREIHGRYTVLFAVDDKACVASKWRELGIPTLLCGTN